MNKNKIFSMQKKTGNFAHGKTVSLSIL